MIPTTSSLAGKTAGFSTFLSFGAKSVQPEMLEKMLVGRRKTVDLLEQYVREIALNGVNHQVLLVGPRGSGKTHLLRVLYHRMADLVRSRQMVVAYFAEEEYGISGYLDVLIRVINAFIRWYDADRPALTAQLNRLRETHPNQQQTVAETIIADYVGDRPLVILSENFDAVLEALGKTGQAQLRAWFYRHNRISVIATAQAASPDLGREDRPFYGFFSLIYLKKLSYDDSLALLTKLAETEQRPDMLLHLAGKGKAQVRAIHDLVKGNHRLLVTFYEFLKADMLADLSVIFMKTMNDLKPYYETFIRFLPPQQQKILHYLALAGTPRQGTDIAKDCFIPTTSLTKQLSELQRRHLIEVLTDPTDKRNKLYEIAEPLLRIAIEIGEQREGIAALFIDFLAVYYSSEEILDQKERFVTLFTQEINALKKQKLGYEIEARGKAFSIRQNMEELAGDVLQNMDKQLELKNFKQVIRESKNMPLSVRDWSYYLTLGLSFLYINNYDKATEYFQIVIEMVPENFMPYMGLGHTYLKKKNYSSSIFNFQKAFLLYEFIELTEIVEYATIKLLQTQTATEAQLIELETWFIDKSEFDTIGSYVTVYRRVVFGQEEKALYDLPREQREFFVREILRRTD